MMLNSLFRNFDGNWKENEYRGESEWECRNGDFYTQMWIKNLNPQTSKQHGDWFTVADSFRIGEIFRRLKGLYSVSERGKLCVKVQEK